MTYPPIGSVPPSPLLWDRLHRFSSGTIGYQIDHILEMCREDLRRVIHLEPSSEGSSNWPNVYEGLRMDLRSKILLLYVEFSEEFGNLPAGYFQLPPEVCVGIPPGLIPTITYTCDSLRNLSSTVRLMPPYLNPNVSRELYEKVRQESATLVDHFLYLSNALDPWV